MNSPSVIRVVGTLLLLLPAALRAQSPRATLTGRFGLASPEDGFQSGCGSSSAALSLDLQRGGHFFPQASLDTFRGSGLGGTGCAAIPGSRIAAHGGLQIDRALRVGLGYGVRGGDRNMHVEGVLLSGVVTGLEGFDPQHKRRHRTMPHITGQATVVMARYVVASITSSWTRLTVEAGPTDAGLLITQNYWAKLLSLQFGLRVPLSR